MQEISTVSRLTSKPRASMERVECKPAVQEMQEVKQFEQQLEQVSRAFTLANEVRHTLESALKTL